jgi:hypothetical protein
VFLNLLKMAALPLVVVNLIAGIASLDDPKSFGRVGGKIMVYYFGTTAIAIVIGLLVGFVFKPGVGFQLAGAYDGTIQTIPSIGQTLVNLIPSNIFASLTPIFPKIGYSCGEPADITWTHYPKALPGGYISNLRTLSEEIFKAYQINASHQDKIFSNAPSHFFVFLEANKVSRNLWTVVFPKRIPKHVVPDNAETELTKYYNNLITRNIDWAIFNAILISLIKEDKFELEKEGVGKLKISKTALNSQLHVEFTSYENDSHHSILVHEYDLNPSAWEARAYEITLFDLRNLF